MNTCRIIGYAVNKRFLTVGIHFDIKGENAKAATVKAMNQAQQDGYSHIRFNQIREVSHV